MAGLAQWFNRRGWRSSIIAIPYAWLIVFFLVPFFIVVAMSLAQRENASPPIAYRDVWPFVYWENYARLLSDSIYIRSYLTSLWNAALTTCLCLLIGYPMALGMTRVSKGWQRTLLMLIILPFWTSFLLRVYAWIGLMGSNSWFNKLLTGAYNTLTPAGYEIASIPLMNTDFAVILVLVYSYLPFMVLPLYANLERLDFTLNEAAMDLGARPSHVFRHVTLPLSVPGIVAGGLLVFIPASGELIIPSLVGNAADPMIGRIINDEFSSVRDWPMASAVAVALLLILVGPIMAFNHFDAKARGKADAS
jgi:putrescine transport system permease protein